MYLHQELTGKIIGACINVHNELGCGFHEKVYQEALAIVLEESGIPFEREKHLPIEFHGRILDCDYIADFVIDNAVILELKAVSEMNSVYEAQVINYLKADWTFNQFWSTRVTGKEISGKYLLKQRAFDNKLINTMTQMKQRVARCTCDGTAKQKISVITCNLLTK